MIRDEHSKKDLDLVEASAIANEPPAYDPKRMRQQNGENWKNCEAYENFRPESKLPFYVFFDGSSKYLKSGHYSDEIIDLKDEYGKTTVQRFYKSHPNGSIMVYDSRAPFGHTQYELI